MLEIVKFEELNYLYDLFENLTRIDYVPLEYRNELKQLLIKAYKDGNQEFEKIQKKLIYLEQLQEELDSLHHAYNELNSQNEKIIKENERLKKVFDILVDFLSLDVDLENDKLITILGCIYFFSDKKIIDELKLLKEVLDNE